MSAHQRAFTLEQKTERRHALVAAAAALFETRRYDAVTMLDIARAAGVAKGTVYVYFRTKEELFLAYAEREVGAFFDGLHARLAGHPDGAGAGVVVAALGAAITQRPAMVRLLALLHLVLESNTTFERALAFRRALLPLLERTGAQVERHLWFLARDSGSRLLLTIHGIALGFQQLADPSPVIREVERQPGMELYQVSFEHALVDTVDLMLAGMEARAAATDPEDD